MCVYALTVGDLNVNAAKGAGAAQKMKFSVTDFSSECDQTAGRKLRIWSHLLEKSIMENFNFCAKGAFCEYIHTKIKERFLEFRTF